MEQDDIDVRQHHENRSVADVLPNDAWEKWRAVLLYHLTEHPFWRVLQQEFVEPDVKWPSFNRVFQFGLC